MYGFFLNLIFLRLHEVLSPYLASKICFWIKFHSWIIFMLLNQLHLLAKMTNMSLFAESQSSKGLLEKVEPVMGGRGVKVGWVVVLGCHLPHLPLLSHPSLSHIFTSKKKMKFIGNQKSKSKNYIHNLIFQSSRLLYV